MNLNLLEYLIACVSEFANTYNMSQKNSFDYLYKYKGIDFLNKHYEIEHTLSIEEAINDLTIICRKNGGDL